MSLFNIVWWLNLGAGVRAHGFVFQTNPLIDVCPWEGWLIKVCFFICRLEQQYLLLKVGSREIM